jgi:hypothetical protein
MSGATGSQDGNLAYENKLGDGLEELLGRGVDNLEALASGLNSLGVKPLNDQVWTAESLEAEFARLGK